MFDPARLVFIDETSTNTAMVRLRGRCPRGIRLIDHVPHGHWKTITFIAGLRRRAMVAPFVLDGPMNATSFMAYLKRCLAPTLKRGAKLITGYVCVVSLDNFCVVGIALPRLHIRWRAANAMPAASHGITLRGRTIWQMPERAFYCVARLHARHSAQAHHPPNSDYSLRRG